jgi:hypothetical protein
MKLFMKKHLSKIVPLCLAAVFVVTVSLSVGAFAADGATPSNEPTDIVTLPGEADTVYDDIGFEDIEADTEGGELESEDIEDDIEASALAAAETAPGNRGLDLATLPDRTDVVYDDIDFEDVEDDTDSGALATVDIKADTENSVFAADETTPGNRGLDLATLPDRTDAVYNDIGFEDVVLYTQPESTGEVYDDIGWEGFKPPTQEAMNAIPAKIAAEISNVNGVKQDPHSGDIPPSEPTTLPYFERATITNYVYTNYTFQPNMDGTIRTLFSGIASSDTTIVTINLYDCSTGQIVSNYSLNGAGWGSNSLEWFGLDPSRFYCFRIDKIATSNSLSFTFDVY